MSSLRCAVTESFWEMCAGDSLSMPVHWFYSVDHIKSEFGSWISDFRRPKETHPSSIMSLSNTAGSGRRSIWSQTEPDIVGTEILHNKIHLWKNQTGTVHYHQGLDAGDNTLNVLVSLRAGLTLVQGGFGDVSVPEARAAVLKDYVDFMTSPGSHRDSYAESWHRDFFRDWRAEKRPSSPEQILSFAENRSRAKLNSAPDSQLDAIGCLPMILPFILLSAPANQDTAVSAALEVVKLTHPHPNVLHTVALFSRALHAVVGGASLRAESERALKALGQWKTCIRYSQQAQRPLIRINMAVVSGPFFFFSVVLLLIAEFPACTGLGTVFLAPDQARSVLGGSSPGSGPVLTRTRRANSFLEELRVGNVERECNEEKCSYEEAREIFPQPQLLEAFWTKYTAGDPCESAPCLNGATCTSLVRTFSCKCAPGFHGHHCDKVRQTSLTCRHKNGGCEHFCSDSTERAPSCTCAEGYRLHRDNASCTPQVDFPCGRPQFFFAPRVVNGQVCPKGHCPWQALLTDNHIFICGAVVLNPRWMLTAAHCVFPKPNSVFHIIVGEHDRSVLENTEQKRRVVKVVVHEDYNRTTSDSDLALLKLYRDVKLTRFVVPVCLPDQNSTFLRTLSSVRVSTVSGWGRVIQNGAAADVLQRVNVPRVRTLDCRALTRLNISRNMLCFGHRSGGQDSCEGDSGGPLVTQFRKTWFLTGIVSWGRGCAQQNQYGVYTRVGNYLDWIQKVIQNDRT